MQIEIARESFANLAVDSPIKYISSDLQKYFTEEIPAFTDLLMLPANFTFASLFRRATFE
ncbi:MAG TPA: hypothetical protein VLZ28_01105 [Daejeonella sp.]|nr:hypothetical protein [Daejeonella sp.]